MNTSPCKKRKEYSRVFINECPQIMIPIFEPYLYGNESKYVNECLDTNWISSQGEFIIRFEEKLAQYHAMEHAIATSSCTAALHISLKALDIGPGDEVICPNLTFIAPANMVVLSGAKLILVDIHPETLTIDQDLIEERITKSTKAIIVVHQFGHAAHMDEIMVKARKHNLKVIEDNAESIGGKYKGRLLGTIGDISTYSFFGNKIVTCGEGGAVLTNDEEVNIKCRELRDHGMNHNEKYHHVALGYNYRMTNMQAAVGLAQIEQLDSILKTRKKQMDLYYQLLSDIPAIQLRQYAEWTEPVHWLTTITLGKDYSRDEFINYMKKRGVDCRQMINPVHWADHFIEHYDDTDFPNAIGVSTQSVHLPSSTALSKEQIQYVVSNIRHFIEQNL